jgi:16S rRNA (guanine1207-N2)-methyltransferase
MRRASPRKSHGMARGRLHSRQRLQELVAEPGILAAAPVLELFGWQGVAAQGGRAVLPWRQDWLAAQARGVPAFARVTRAGLDRYTQAVVHLQKSRSATWYGLHEAWKRLREDGRLLLVGGNELGVKSAVKRLEEELQQKSSTLAVKARGRVVEFRRATGAGPCFTPPQVVEVELGRPWRLVSPAGVFSEGKLDRGTRLLLNHLPSRLPAERIFDPGCGIGLLGLAALLGSPDGRACLADAHAWAADAAEKNAGQMGLASRCEVLWWDAQAEPPPGEGYDLAVLNPPFHGQGKAVDLRPARALFRTTERVLAPHGRALVVANRKLPYERDLGAWAKIEEIAVEQGFKLLEVCRR